MTLQMREGTPLNKHLDELNSAQMELCDIDVNMEDTDLETILLAFPHTSYNNFVSSLSVGKGSITLEEVKSNLSSPASILESFD